jgi:hypothetical protein
MNNVYRVTLLLLLTASLSRAEIPLHQLPTALQRAINREAHGDQIASIEQDDQEEGKNFTITVTNKSGGDRYFIVNEEGDLLGEQIELNQAPEAVQKTIRAEIQSGVLENLERSIDAGVIEYDVEYNRPDGKDGSLSVAPDGNLIGKQVDLESIPETVQKTIAAHVKSGTVEKINRILEDGQTLYEVDFLREGRSRDMAITPQGKLERSQVFMSEVPGPAQKTIREKLGAGRVLRIDHSFVTRGGVNPFEVLAVQGKKPFNFSVGPRGKFLGMDD